MNVIETAIPQLLIVEPQVFGDRRGWFYESWSERDFAAAGLHYRFVQDNRSYSKERGTMRGIHFQKGEHAQAKLVRCDRGAVIDVAVDLRKGSPHYAQWVAAELTEENKRQFLIPRGFGHIFLTLTEDVEFCYKTDNFYNGEADRSIRYDDPDIGIAWERWDVQEPVLSEKDRTAPFLKDSDADFVY
ncbi:MAG: dTDP-4-dehydrorhamnose 3,5-epimerase [Clostridiales Family XIII bacterium]|nr:dTDP-4-dehydrorhamnose 3,5-epimerase [Clostridiales Family XIII bacterium]